jgi:hypothetical protein
MRVDPDATVAAPLITGATRVDPLIVNVPVIVPVSVGLLMVGVVSTCPVEGGGSFGRKTPPADAPIIELLCCHSSMGYVA